jgi:integrase
MTIHLGFSQMKDEKKYYIPLRYSIGESISPRHWSRLRCKAIELKAYPHHTLLNIRLRLLENIVHSVVLELKNNDIIPTRHRIRELLDIRLRKSKGKIAWNHTHSFVSFIEYYIERSTHHKSNSTVRQYRNTLRLLLEFSKDSGRALDFEDIDLEFHAAFKKYMTNLGYSETYFSNQIKFIRLFMNEATEQGYNKQLVFKSRKFASPMPSSTKIYLTEAEITQIQQLNTADNLLLTVVRDLFIIGCRTGLRYSDLIRLSPSNFNEEGRILRINTQKTNELVYIPLSPDVMQICQKYHYSLPRIGNGIFNLNIKRIACLAGIEDVVEIVTKRGISKKREHVKKYKLVSSHTARRSFATNAYLANIPSIAIMRITGHRTERAFMSYIRISSENNAKQLLRHPHFLKDNPQN